MRAAKKVSTNGSQYLRALWDDEREESHAQRSHVPVRISR